MSVCGDHSLKKEHVYPSAITSNDSKRSGFIYKRQQSSPLIHMCNSCQMQMLFYAYNKLAWPSQWGVSGSTKVIPCVPMQDKYSILIFNEGRKTNVLELHCNTFFFLNHCNLCHLGVSSVHASWLRIPAAVSKQEAHSSNISNSHVRERENQSEAKEKLGNELHSKMKSRLLLQTKEEEQERGLRGRDKKKIPFVSTDHSAHFQHD